MVGSSESNVACMVGSPRNFQTNLAYDIIDEEPEEEELELESEKNPGKSPKQNRGKLSLERSPNLDRSSLDSNDLQFSLRSKLLELEAIQNRAESDETDEKELPIEFHIGIRKLSAGTSKSEDVNKGQGCDRSSSFSSGENVDASNSSTTPDFHRRRTKSDRSHLPNVTSTSTSSDLSSLDNPYVPKITVQTWHDRQRGIVRDSTPESGFSRGSSLRSAMRSKRSRSSFKGHGERNLSIPDGDDSASISPRSTTSSSSVSSPSLMSTRSRNGKATDQLPPGIQRDDLKLDLTSLTRSDSDATRSTVSDFKSLEHNSLENVSEISYF